MNKKRVGCATDPTGNATYKYEIIAETTDGRYVCLRDGDITIKCKSELVNVHYED